MKQNTRKKTILIVSRIPALALFLTLLVSCAPLSVYNVDPHYLSSPHAEADRGDTTRPPLTVALFGDERQMEDRMLVGRVIEVDGRVSPVLPRHTMPEQAVTQALTAYLTQRGYTVSIRNPRWDLRNESIDPGWGKILLGGRIHELFVECDRSKPLRTYATRVALAIVLADAEKKQVLHRVTVETTPTRQFLRFSEARMEEELSQALSEALERAFSDSELAAKIAALAGNNQ